MKQSILSQASLAPRPLRLPLLIAMLCIGVLPTLPARAAGPVIPGAGTVLQQVEPVTPLAPPSNDTGLHIQQPPSSALPASIAIRIEHIEIVGNSKIDAPTLHALVTDAEGRDLNLTQIGELAARITAYYRAHGFPLARAIIPAQTMQAGVVRIEVIEARYGKITLNNRSRVSDRLLQATLDKLYSGEVVSQDELNRCLLLLADIPGLAIDATMKTGGQAGTSDLQVNARSTPMATGSVTVDNGGDAYTGRTRVGANANVFDLLHQGDVLSVNGLTAGNGLTYGRLSYDALLNGNGTRLGGAYSTLDYRLKGALSALDATGSAQVASLWLKQPLIRSLGLNLYGQLEYDHLQLNDNIQAVGIQNDRHLDNLTGSVSGNVRDGMLAGAVTAWNVGWTYGHVGFNDAATQAIDAVTTHTQGDFSKLGVNLVRFQSLGDYDALYFNLNGQWASGNLDASQQLVVGGPNSVRAYDNGIISGDVGYTLTSEYRHTLAQSWHGQWQAIAFFDAAHLEVNRATFSTGANTANLAGAGIGLNWSGPDQLAASFSLAVPVGATPAQISDRSTLHAWLLLSKGF
ncbi:ShlB/FhaC/HecB family hemolysin secretion/activation protein [Burkholderia sp. L27(2015)]|uniref:ShlB/FhaC/HecB family hemolysin secretion/activation protein n=1 Tax=Burkholderia sp. L27(2015) TaxID=1641858 RepID=UPI00131E6FEA|nr:POTRA domain-containing protein [Burkholderia sp. L27(2015)]